MAKTQENSKSFFSIWCFLSTNWWIWWTWVLKLSIYNRILEKFIHGFIYAVNEIALDNSSNLISSSERCKVEKFSESHKLIDKSVALSSKTCTNNSIYFAHFFIPKEMLFFRQSQIHHHRPKNEHCANCVNAYFSLMKKVKSRNRKKNKKAQELYYIPRLRADDVNIIRF